MTNSIACSVADCEKPSRKLKMCGMHYNRFTKHGSTDKPVVKHRRVPVADRFWPKVNKGEGCWTWTGSTNGVGYGKIHDGEKLVYAHRLSWQMANGDIPEGGVIDHICHTPGCVRPSHLRLVTKKQNVEHRAGATRTNRTGHRNVYQRPDGVYYAQVSPNGETIHLGSFVALEDAVSAAEVARRQYFTHAD